MQNAQKTAYAARKIAEIDGFETAFSAPKFNEFVVRGPKPAVDVLKRLREASGVIGGLALSKYYSGRENEFLVCVTETNTRQQIDKFAHALANR